tara:strand:- start:3810 stop:4079 length:270 start_codon:yes stop_codon:yes gene_type:complete
MEIVAGSEKSLKNKLDEHYNWPSLYKFKFIVPVNSQSHLIELLPDGDLSIKKSRNGKYSSISLNRNITSSMEVIDIYRKVRSVDNLISL